MKAGAYQVDARAVVQRRVDDISALGTLTLALLTAQPTPEGGGLSELKAEGYARQDLTVGVPTYGSRVVTNSHPLRFVGVLDWPRAAYAVVIDSNGEALAYGPLRSSPGSAGADEIVFAPTAIRVRFK